MSLVVYTAITDGYDTLLDPPDSVIPGSDFVAYVESSGFSKIWSYKPLERKSADPCRDAKVFKILPHIIFPDAEYTLWIDGSIEFLMPFPVVDLLDYLAGSDMAIFEHPIRTCIYQEACECLRRRLDDPQIIFRQMFRYTREGYPSNQGLAEASVILRRNTKAMKQFNEQWWDEIDRGSKRDQLSFNYIAWRSRCKITFFPDDLVRGSLFRRLPHKPIA
jgi:hypothetical protein